MLPQSLLRTSVSVEGERLLPHYFTVRDEAWLARLIEEWRKLVGHKRAELRRLTEDASGLRAPRAKLRVAIHVLERLCRVRPKPPLAPKTVRAAVFEAAAKSDAPRERLLGALATSLGVSVLDLEESLFADLGGEASVAAPPADLSAARLRIEVNFAIVVALVRRAVQVRIALWSEGRALVRRARAMGLICTVSALEPTGVSEELRAVNLEVSGPFSLFRHSDLYGRALGALVGSVAHYPQYELSARCALQRAGALSTFVLGPGDLIFAEESSAPPLNAAQLRFARDFARLALDWELLSDPPPRVRGERLLFPDFELVHRQDSQRRWLLELVGFWTGRSLADKLAQLQEMGIERFVLCVDRGRSCAKDDLPCDERVMGYTARIDVGALLRLIERQP